MRFGDYDCVSVVLDSFFLDGGAMFGVVPKTLWGKKIPADDNNCIPMSARSLLIRGQGKVILVDTGIGDKLSQKFKNIYGIKPTANSMDVRLAPLGVAASDVTDVILSHLHFDHCGGSTEIKDGTLSPAFPNATYHLQKRQWEYAFNPCIRDRSSYLAENYLPLLEQKKLNLIDGETKDLFNGIRIIVTDGHTPAMQHPLIIGNSSSLFFCSDLMPTSAHIPVTWIMGYDNYPLTLMDEKTNILKQALEGNWILFFAHDPKIPAVGIKQDGKGIVLDQEVAL